MNTEDILKKLPSGGLLKITAPGPATLKGEKRAALIRKGNELFNKGEIGLAQRIFFTTRYSDGLIRIGDHYIKQGRPLDALRVYWLAPAPDKKEALVEKIAQVMKQWLAEGKTKTQ
ncbi:MAG TPA: hypothetical protein VHE79_05515 [Spirochaetia bacterium]